MSLQKMPVLPSPRRIESRQNSRVKELRAGLQRGGRTDHGHLAIEGEHLVHEAIRSGLRPRTIFVREGSEGLVRNGAFAGAEILLLPDTVFSSAVNTEHPQGIAALIDPPDFHLDQLFVGVPLIVIAAGLQDPGNLGTLTRSAEAFGATGMILLPGTVSLWNAKALRASSGSSFRLPSVALAQAEALSSLRARGVRLFATVARDGNTEPDFSGPGALLIGNEGAGLPDAWVEQADECITIACPGPVESLNAAVAGSVLLYEAARQRQAASARESSQSRLRARA